MTTADAAILGFSDWRISLGELTRELFFEGILVLCMVLNKELARDGWIEVFGERFSGTTFE